ncbi:hypothetical protein [Streptomyces sp. NPDC008122]|uniref:hypothetical protein n=1 Tax=Streptomyces sp. NPDC008122 TaxID=3364810 RepID=UPI0036E934F7
MSTLMSHSAAHSGGLQVAWSGTALTRPHIVEVELTNVGNKDLEPVHFNGAPVEVTSTVPVVALLQERSEPPVQRVLASTPTAAGLTLATTTPLHKGQTLTYVLLVDGADPEIGLQESVSNASFERRDPPSPGSEIAAASRSARMLAAAAIMLMVVLITISYAIDLTFRISELIY